MIASRRPRGRKWSAARMTACSKSGCSKSLTGRALLRLPLPRVSQRGEDAEIKAGKRVQPLPQRREPALRLAELLADGPEHRPDAWGFRRGDLEQALEAPVRAEVSEQPVHGLLGRQLAR